MRLYCPPTIEPRPRISSLTVQAKVAHASGFRKDANIVCSLSNQYGLTSLDVQDLMSEMFRFCTARGPTRKKMELEMTVDRVDPSKPKSTRLLVKSSAPDKAATLVTDWQATMGTLHTDLQAMVTHMDSLFGLVRQDGKVTRVVVKTAPGQAREIREIKVVKENCKRIENKKVEEAAAAVEEEEESTPADEELAAAAKDDAAEEQEEEEDTKEVLNITTSKQADSLTIIVT